MTPKKMGRPPKKPGESSFTPVRNFGRVPDDIWAVLRSAAERSGKSFIGWALPILLDAAKRQK